MDRVVRELLAHPEHLHTLRAQPDRWNDAVEESPRVHRPVMRLPM
ncbi:hypothetical protein ACIRQP_39800 [Streptomyces sp. NPDC102274]